MDPIKVEVFLSVPACSGGVAVRRLIEDVQKEYGDQMDVVYHQGRDERYEELKCPRPRPSSSATWCVSSGYAPPRKASSAR